MATKGPVNPFAKAQRALGKAAGTRTKAPKAPAAPVIKNSIGGADRQDSMRQFTNNGIMEQTITKAKAAKVNNASARGAAMGAAGKMRADMNRASAPGKLTTQVTPESKQRADKQADMMKSKQLRDKTMASKATQQPSAPSAGQKTDWSSARSSVLGARSSAPTKIAGPDVQARLADMKNSFKK
jgi:hypothetical protein